jgi:hypothetical protein
LEGSFLLLFALEEDEGVFLRAAVVTLVKPLLLGEGHQVAFVELALSHDFLVFVDEGLGGIVLKLMGL